MGGLVIRQVLVLREKNIDINVVEKNCYCMYSKLSYMIKLSNIVTLHFLYFSHEHKMCHIRAVYCVVLSVPEIPPPTTTGSSNS